MSNIINIPFDVNNFYFFLFEHNSDTPIENPSLPLGVGMNNNIQYDLGGYIRINKNLLSSEIVSATLYLSGNQSVGNIYVYPHSSTAYSSSAFPTNFDYELNIKDTYVDSSDGFIFKLKTDSFITRYTVFDISNIYLSLEFTEPLVNSTYIDLGESKIRYKIGDYFDKNKIIIKAETGCIKRTINSFISSITDQTQINSSVMSLTVSFKIGSSNYSNTINIDAFNDCFIDIPYDADYYNQPKTASSRIFDIIFPSGALDNNNNDIYPTIITIHGGGFNTGSKEYYNYITPFILSKNCIHVNINYRLMPLNSYDRTEGHSYYLDIIDDIQKLVKFLCNNATIYRINTSKITLMGHSAGGNLALVYGLSHFVFEDINNSNNNIPFKGIITEGAVTYSELEEHNYGSEVSPSYSIIFIDDPPIMKCYVPMQPTNKREEIINDLYSLLGIELDINYYYHTSKFNLICPLSMENNNSTKVLIMQGTNLLSIYNDPNLPYYSTYLGDGVIVETDAYNMLLNDSNTTKHFIQNLNHYSYDDELQNDNSDYYAYVSDFIDSNVI